MHQPFKGYSCIAAFITGLDRSFYFIPRLPLKVDGGGLAFGIVEVTEGFFHAHSDCCWGISEQRRTAILRGYNRKECQPCFSVQGIFHR